jgi:hypothetical protein
MSSPAAPDVSTPEIFDVTIRDGSYVIDFQFEREDVRLLCSALERAGFRYIEVGHGLGLNASAAKGAAASSDADYLGAAVQSRRHARYGAFSSPASASASIWPAPAKRRTDRLRRARAHRRSGGLPAKNPAKKSASLRKAFSRQSAGCEPR